jgi:peptidoglycan/xylan/chitin deacetylase (PgdA/CDA1 family)
LKLARLKSAFQSFHASRHTWRIGRRFHPPGVAVLMYHRVGRVEPFYGLNPQTFGKHIEWLATNCEIIAPQDLQESCRRSATSSRRKVVLTFDDGFAGYYEHAYPVLKRHGVPAAVFLATASIDDPSLLIWPDRVTLAVTRTTRQSIAAPWNERLQCDLSTPHRRRVFIHDFKMAGKLAPDAERRRMIEHMIAALDIGDLSTSRQMMNWDEVRAASDITTWGGHTHTHPILSRVTDEDLDYEVRMSRDRIAEKTGKAPRLFAYPNGRTMDYDERSRAALSKYGFEIAFATDEGLNGPGTDWHAVRRLPGDCTVAELAWMMSGLGAAGRNLT